MFGSLSVRDATILAMFRTRYNVIPSPHNPKSATGANLILSDSRVTNSGVVQQLGREVN